MITTASAKVEKLLGKARLDHATMELVRVCRVNRSETAVPRIKGRYSVGRILAIDFGTRRVGAALSDPGRTIAFPLEVYEPRGRDADARHYREVVQENEVERIVVGLPLHNSGREGQAASQSRAFGDWLSAITGRPIVYFDERYSTVEAEQRLIDSGLSRQKRKAPRQAGRPDRAPRLPRRRLP